MAIRASPAPAASDDPNNNDGNLAQNGLNGNAVVEASAEEKVIVIAPLAATS